MLGLQIPTLIYLFERFIYFQDWSVYFAAAKYVDRSWEYRIAHRHMNVEIGADAGQFLEKEYIYEFPLQCSELPHNHYNVTTKCCF
jgi:hypothetical protein